jgi:hypothetical protein
MSRGFSIGLIAALGCAIASASLRGAERSPAGADVTVLRSDSRGIVLEFRPRYLPTRLVDVQGRGAVIQDFDGALQEGTSAAVGGPDLRFRHVPLAFPSDEGNRVAVLTAEYEDLPGTSIAPIPFVRMKDDLPASAAYAENRTLYGADGFLPRAVVQLSPVSRVRGMLLGGVRLFPVQFNAATRTARKYSRIVVEVAFGVQNVRLPLREGERGPAPAPLNYNVARGWMTTESRSVAAPVSSVLASGDWYRLTINDDGMYRLDPAYLASLGINIATLDPRTIRIYGNGGQELPEDPAAIRPQDLTEVAIYVAGESDGKMDAGDFVAFYGAGPRGWAYDRAARTFRHYIHHYAEVNYYWLTTGGVQGKRMALQPSFSSAVPATPVERTVALVASEEEKINLLSSGKDWYGQTLGPGGSFTFVNQLYGLIPGDVIRYRYNLIAHSEAAPSFQVSQSGTPIGQHFLGLSFDYLYATAGTFEAAGSSTLPTAGSSQLLFHFNAASVSASGWIDWIEILYPRLLWAQNNWLEFHGPDTSGVIEYRLQQFTAEPLVFNVSAHNAVKLVTGLTGSFLFRALESAGASSSYRAVTGAGWRVPAAVAKIQNQDLHGYAAGADFVIITSAEFRSAADRLAAHRALPAHGGLKTLVVDVDQIYNEFSGGIPDVTAIRDYLRFAYTTWVPRPGFAMFLGQGSYDYKGLLGARSSYVPTWQSAESRDDVDSYCTDDFFAKFGPGDAPSMVLGRVSARTSAEAEAFVDKLQRYEGSSAPDSWKMRSLFVGDDAWTPEGGELGDGTIHSDDAETLADYYTPDEIEKKKIYTAEYPTVWSAQGRRKPGAAQDIIDQINRGMLIVNYSGHGNPTLWAHENIFNVATSIPQLVNGDRLTLFFLATCNFSQYDDPKRYTGSELLLNKPDGAGIAVVSATRKVYQGSNAALNRGTYQRMFGRNALGRVSPERPASALYLYKAEGGNYINDQKFCYMGDPTMYLQYPRGYARIDSINGEAVDSVGGAPRTSPIQLRSLSRVRVSGTVRDGGNAVDLTYKGRVTLGVNDATRIQTIVNFYPGVNWDYVATGGTIYRGENTVQGGRFSATFIVPKDIQYADSTARGRMIAYLYRDIDRTADGEAYTGNIRIGGTDSAFTNDNRGPAMSIFLGSRNFRPGDVVGESPTLYVDLADSNGINTSVSGIGHRIEAWLNSATQSRDLTEFYTSKLDSYREGSVQYPLGDLPQGKNTLRVRAWDSFNNSATIETYFDVASTDRLTVSDVFNYPNPFGGEGTSFTFRQNQSLPLNVSVKVFTVAGRLIRTLDAQTPGDSFVRVPWDGRDRDGDVIANGVYLYKLTVRTADGRFTSETLGKLSKVQ